MKEEIRNDIDKLIQKIDNNCGLSEDEIADVIMNLNKVWLKVYQSKPND